MEPIIFNMATMPVRERSLQETVSSIIDQCDELNIYMNGWNHVPDFLHHPKINIFRSQDHRGDLGDVGKFFRCAKWKGYIFTVDDKIIYPANYAATMIDAIEKYGRQAVISLHGRMLKPSCNSYYHDYERAIRCLDYHPEDTFAHVLGTGVMAFHSSTFKVKLSHFKSTNMSDIWMSIALQKAKVPILLLKHNSGWIRLSRKQDNRLSISSFCSRNDKPQTDAVNALNWRMFTCPLLS
jgi:hypothetical protein